jgi:ribosomal protein S27E
MDPMTAPIGGDAQMVVCPNCGNRQAMSGVDARCDRCGTLLDPAGSGKQGLVNPRPVGVADPTQVPPATVAGGIGGTNDGTQVTHHVSTAVPGKPMAPIADDPAGHSTEEGQAMPTPSSAARAGRGGSG